MNKRMDSSKEKRKTKKNTNEDGQMLTNQEKKLLKAQTFVDHVERSRMQRYENQRQEKCCIKLLSYARHISAVTLRLMFFAINLIMLYYCIMNLDWCTKAQSTPQQSFQKSWMAQKTTSKDAQLFAINFN